MEMGKLGIYSLGQRCSPGSVVYGDDIRFVSIVRLLSLLAMCPYFVAYCCICKNVRFSSVF